jgi:hypothetical protein
MPARLTLSLCQVEGDGDVYVEARAKKQPLPVAALEHHQRRSIAIRCCRPRAPSRRRCAAFCSGESAVPADVFDATFAQLVVDAA